ncbi:hypothetical protein COV19_01345 [Candidatus Woesearchaeota archaeon CG10_big_fil_rev_8_21_14_0_10_44_13]|nr:MAG: hypothetical protein COV19_01345 [Candidatus Woesearchaeota archaeon CG10_big_fil_rev_8_21_14_0_10_44_13]
MTSKPAKQTDEVPDDWRKENPGLPGSRRGINTNIIIPADIIPIDFIRKKEQEKRPCQYEIPVPETEIDEKKGMGYRPPIMEIDYTVRIEMI